MCSVMVVGAGDGFGRGVYFVGETEMGGSGFAGMKGALDGGRPVKTAVVSFMLPRWRMLPLVWLGITGQFPEDCMGCCPHVHQESKRGTNPWHWERGPRGSYLV